MLDHAWRAYGMLSAMLSAASGSGGLHTIAQRTVIKRHKSAYQNKDFHSYLGLVQQRSHVLRSNLFSRVCTVSHPNATSRTHSGTRVRSRNLRAYNSRPKSLETFHLSFEKQAFVMLTFSDVFSGDYGVNIKLLSDVSETISCPHHHITPWSL
jgi:hypothetical protein